MNIVHILLVVLLVLLLLGMLPVWPHAAALGYGPVSFVGLLLIALIVVLVLKR